MQSATGRIRIRRRRSFSWLDCYAQVQLLASCRNVPEITVLAICCCTLACNNRSARRDGQTVQSSIAGSHDRKFAVAFASQRAALGRVDALAHIVAPHERAVTSFAPLRRGVLTSSIGNSVALARAADPDRELVAAVADSLSALTVDYKGLLLRMHQFAALLRSAAQQANYAPWSAIAVRVEGAAVEGDSVSVRMGSMASTAKLIAADFAGPAPTLHEYGQVLQAGFDGLRVSEDSVRANLGDLLTEEAYLAAPWEYANTDHCGLFTNDHAEIRCRASHAACSCNTFVWLAGEAYCQCVHPTESTLRHGFALTFTTGTTSTLAAQISVSNPLGGPAITTTVPTDESAVDCAATVATLGKRAGMEAKMVNLKEVDFYTSKPPSVVSTGGCFFTNTPF